MQVYEWLMLAAAWAVPIGALVFWMFGIKEKAERALAETEKIMIRVEDICTRLSRGDDVFDGMRTEFGLLQRGIARIEEQVRGVKETLDFMRHNRER